MSLMKMVCYKKSLNWFILYKKNAVFCLSGNGEIDFEEFLTLMTSTEKFLENLRGEQCISLNNLHIMLTWYFRNEQE